MIVYQSHVLLHRGLQMILLAMAAIREYNKGWKGRSADSTRTMRTGLQEADRDIETMRAGLPGRSLWFAGEHTAPFIALGTTTGAYMSGEAVARRIAAAYGKDNATNGEDVQDFADIESSDGTKEVNIRGFADKALEK